METPKKPAATGFRPLDHTADRATEAWAPTLEGLFRAAAEGMFAESVSCESIAPDRQWDLEVGGDSVEELLRAWLSELLWVSERDDAAVCRVEVAEVSDHPWRVHGRAWGGPPPPDSPHTGAPVKAVTYHGLRVWRDGNLWRARVVFDV